MDPEFLIQIGLAGALMYAVDRKLDRLVAAVTSTGAGLSEVAQKLADHQNDVAERLSAHQNSQSVALDSVAAKLSASQREQADKLGQIETRLGSIEDALTIETADAIGFRSDGIPEEETSDE